MIKKVNLLSLFFFIFTSSFTGKEDSQRFNYFNSLVNYPTPVTNGAAGLAAGFLSAKLLQKNNSLILKRFPSMKPLAYGISVIFPFLITAWRAKKLYNVLNYEYIIKNFDSIKRQDYWFDKSAMIDDFKTNLLEKSGFEKDSVFYDKYRILLDILTKSPNKIIEELEKYDQQEDFLSAVLLLDAEKSGDLKFEYLKNIKETFKETSVLEKKLSNSVFFNSSETIKDFLNKVYPEIGARFIVEYKDDIKNFIDSFISLDLEKKQNIFSAVLNKQERGKDHQLIRILTDPIVFEIIVEAYNKSEEHGCFLLKNLSEDNFFSLICYVFFIDGKNEKVNIKYEKLDTFFNLIKYFYQKNKENISDIYNPFNKSANILCKKDEENKTKILRWWLGKAGYKREQSQETKSTVNLPEKPKDNNYQDNHLISRFSNVAAEINDTKTKDFEIQVSPINNSRTAQDRLTRFSSIIMR